MSGNTVCNGAGGDNPCGVHDGFEVRKLKRNGFDSDIVCPHPSCPHQVARVNGVVLVLVGHSGGDQHSIVQRT